MWLLLLLIILFVVFVGVGILFTPLLWIFAAIVLLVAFFSRGSFRH